MKRRTTAILTCLALGLGTSCGSDPAPAIVTLSVEPSPIQVRSFNFGHANVGWLAWYTVTVRESAGVAATVTAFRAQALDQSGQDHTINVTASVKPADPAATLPRFLPASLAASGSLQILGHHVLGAPVPGGGPPPPYPLRFEIAVDVTDANGHSSTARLVAGDARTGP